MTNYLVAQKKIYICTQQIVKQITEDKSKKNDFIPKLVGSYTKFWQNGSTLKVRFMNGSTFIKNKVKQIALQWSNHANIHFEFVEYGYAEIRILFNERGKHDSYVGTDANLIPQDSQTMNIGFMQDKYPEHEYKRVILHEFGHAIGLEHEHQNPNVSIPWDKAAVYNYYAQTQGWDKVTVDNNILSPKQKVRYSKYDSKSIMHYAVANELTIGDFEIDWNYDLSPIDKNIISKIYSNNNNNSNRIKPNYNGRYNSSQSDISQVNLEQFEREIKVTWTFNNNTRQTLNLKYKCQSKKGAKVYSCYYDGYIAQNKRTYFKRECQIFLYDNGKVVEKDIDYINALQFWHEYKKQK